MSASTTIATLLPNASSTDIEVIKGLVEAQLLNRLGGIDTVESVPEELEYIVVNVTLARYNQRGDEGKNSMSIEGESAAWLTDLFEPFEEDIQKYLARNNGSTGNGTITFL